MLGRPAGALNASERKHKIPQGRRPARAQTNASSQDHANQPPRSNPLTQPIPRRPVAPLPPLARLTRRDSLARSFVFRPTQPPDPFRDAPLACLRVRLLWVSYVLLLSCVFCLVCPLSSLCERVYARGRARAYEYFSLIKHLVVTNKRPFCVNGTCQDHGAQTTTTIRTRSILCARLADGGWRLAEGQLRPEGQTVGGAVLFYNHAPALWCRWRPSDMMALICSFRSAAAALVVAASKASERASERSIEHQSQSQARHSQ